MQRSSRQKPGAGQRGQSMVEFAIAMAVIMVFLFGVIDWGMAYHMQQRIVHQAAEAARWVSVRGTDPTIRTPAKNIVLCGRTTCTSNDFVPSGLTATMISVEPYTQTDQVSAGIPGGNRKHIVVQVLGYQYRMFTPFIGKLLTPRKIVVSHPMECQQAICPEIPSYTP